MRVISITQAHSLLMAQGLPEKSRAFVCPACGTVQNFDSYLAAAKLGGRNDLVKVPSRFRDLIGFVCAGNLIGAPPPRAEPDGLPCDYTISDGGDLHTLEIETEGGDTHPHFEIATPEAAKALAALQASNQEPMEDACRRLHNVAT